MDGDTSTSHQDQISLYGLFGDSSATLQGLNDHLSPSLLQQSPPCGSTLSGHTTTSKAVITSPPKSVTNGLQHGVLLSDLADRSPSAGSVTAASLCNYVSFGNQRCTNLVTIKGKRFCNQHSAEPAIGVSLVKKAIFKKPIPTTSLKQLEGFLPITKSETFGGNIPPKVVQSGANTTIITAVSSVRTTPSQTLTSKSNGLDVSDNAKLAELGSVNTNLKGQQVHLVRKVGRKITVSTRPIALKMNEPINSKQEFSIVGTSNKVGMPKYQTTNSTKQAPARNPPSANRSTGLTIPYYKKLETVTMTSQMKDGRVPQVVGASTSVVNAASTHVVSASSKNKLGGADEVVLRKLLEVLNSKNDLSAQEQISLLQSMGVTIVQAPATSGSTSSLKKSGGIMKTIDAVGAKSFISGGHLVKSPKTVTPFPVLPAYSFNQNSINGPNSAGISFTAPSPDLSSSVKGLKHQSGSMAVAVAPSKVKKSVSKTAQKRKQKPPDDGLLKKSKFSDTEGSGDLKHRPTSDPRKSSSSKMPPERLKSKKANNTGQNVASYIIASPLPNVLRLPPEAPVSLKDFIHYLNEKTLLHNDLFTERSTEVEEDAVKADKSKILKLRLLKKHASRRARPLRMNCKRTVDYRQCLEDVKSADLLKTFSAASNLLGLLSKKKQSNAPIHYERILDNIFHKNGPQKIDCELAFDEDLTGDAPSEETKGYTVDTLLLKHKYNKIALQLKQEEKQLDMLLRCFDDHPNSTIQTINSYVRSKPDCKPRISNEPSKVQLCQLSSDKVLSCSKRALPYASYCKEHIWHCDTQCLYKLDQNMKTTADINPEPMVKRVRKRAKLLPLIKKYKKKKKKKAVEGNEHQDPVKDDYKLSAVTKPTVSHDLADSDRSTSQQSTLSIGSNVLLAGNDELNLKMDSDVEDVKRSDSSDDDLNLTTSEIMLSGVLDKLADDPHDFDLFTEKNAEELERALLLAAASPISEEPSDVSITPNTEHDTGTLPATSRTNSLQNLNARMLSNPRLNASPDAIVNCDAPKSDEQPPSLENFNESQIAHYTFGSSVTGVVKKECQNESFPVGDDSMPPLWSAEDLKDIEGVLERLHAEDVNSPKLPSSPAVDQYTSMLARQLSQEAECESMKQDAACSSSSRQVTTMPFSTESQSMSTSFVLSASNLSPKSTLSTNKTHANVSYTTEVASTQLQQPVIQFRKPPMNSQGTTTPVMKNIVSLSQEVIVAAQSNIQSQQMMNVKGTSGANVRTDRGITVATTPDNTMKNVGKIAGTPGLKGAATLTVGTSSRIVQGKSPQTANILQNQVLPLTLMQTQSQNGNVIKVIVPPGTVVNGANGQQNMLLIPVSALVKSNMQSGNQNIPLSLASSNPNQGQSTTVNVKTQLSNLPAGQQFFIVNNAPAGSSQTHLALVQKSGNAGAPQGILLKPQGTTTIVKEGTTYVQRQISQDRAKRISSNFKSGLNVQIKQGNGSLDQSGKLSTYVTPNSLSIASVSGTIQAGSSTDASKMIPTEFSKLQGTRTQSGRRKPKNTPRKPKARFDPVTRKYVPVTDGSASSSAATVPISMPASSHTNMSESLIKFNESALSIQNKVQQIDSVLSSLNAAAKNQSTNVKGQDMKNRAGSYTVKSVVHHSNNYTLKSPTNSKSITAKTVTLATSTMTLPKGMVQTKTLASSAVSLPQTSMNISMTSGSGMHKVQKCTTTSSVNSEGAPKRAADTFPATTTTGESPSKVPSSPVGSGTVHWNQTTTAGPEITTTTLTVPVYITGAIPATSWGSELTLSRSLGGATLPVILPARKISPSCQLSQRVLLGNIGSLAVPGKARVTPTTSSSILQRSIITVPQSVVTMPKTKISSSGDAKQFDKSTYTLSNRSVSVTLGETAAQRAEAILKLTSLNSVAGVRVTSSLPIKSTTPSAAVSDGEAGKSNKTLGEQALSHKKSGRETTRDRIVHDSLMYDPSMLDRTTTGKSE